ncbi:glycoside hydrolase family 10 protein [Leptolyngbya sp. PCC 6406]|uniref:glycoside hydrolase family 10 protein n=1 Tax=Leptolyngbya sp. PCC 6406 TaxID=1173264 RepID=UPI0002ACB8D2|nr:family 10 glycosylhydrolase [Leptolyngbya sp. PCC 6406]
MASFIYRLLSQRTNREVSRAVRRLSTGQRLATGILLGLIWAILLGAMVPLMAQTLPQAPNAVLSQVVTPSNPPGNRGSEPPRPPRAVDIQNHWAADCLQALSDRQLLPLDRDQRFHPEAAATWADLATLLTQGLPAAGVPYQGANAAERALGLASPVNPLHTYPDRYYDANRTITRAEALTALAARAGLPYVARPGDLLRTGLTDGARVPLYGREGVAAALSAGRLVNQAAPQTLSPNQVATRAEVAALVCKASPESALQATIPPAWVTPLPELPPQIQPLQEVRGVWMTNIDSTVLFSQANLAAGVARLKALNFNTLYPVVWNGGYTLHPSAIAERMLGRAKRLYPNESPALEAAQGDRDMLRELIDLAHAEGMAVVPWFEFGFMAPAEASYPLRREHPDWFTQRRDGTQDDVQGAETFVWMNPFHPQVQRLLLLLVDEVLQNYDVEGIQFDDHLGLPVAMGYDPYTVNLYRQDHGGTAPSDDESDAEWVRWRAEKITTFVEGLHRLVKNRQPQAIVSISPNPYPFSYGRYLQDWPTWEQRGFVEELVVQVYRNELDRFAWELNKPSIEQARRHISTSIGLLSGLRGRPTDGALLTEQLAATRDRAYAGVSYFFYETLWVAGAETAEERLHQFQSGFALPVPRPGG